MASESVISSLWRRKWIVLATVLCFAAVAAVVSQALPKEYEASVELLIVQDGDDQNFDAVQAAQVSARTYGNIVTSPNVARLVLADADLPLTASELADKVTAEPIPETQLLQITLVDGDAQRVRRLADLYAGTFVRYVSQQLTPATGVSVSLADRASVPQGPARPKPTVYVLLATLIGLGIGAGLAVLRDRSDSRLRSAEQIETDFDLPILARIPPLGRKRLDQQAFSEAFRVMRSNLQFMSYERPVRSIAFTSFHAGEGKSTTVGELALAIGSSGSQVVAVEGDVRRPSLQSIVLPDEPQPLAPGLTDLVIGTSPLDEVVHPTQLRSLSFVPSGRGVPAFSDLIQSDRGRQLSRLSEEFPLVLIDLPPLSAGADAVAVAARTDAVILVVDLTTATRSTVAEALRQLQAVRANVLGVVVNQDSEVSSIAYGYDAPERVPPVAVKR